MKRHSFILFGLVLLFALSAGAQNSKCVVVRGIAQEHLLDFGNPDWEGGQPGHPWVGPVQLSLGNEALVGKVSEYDGEPGPSNHTGQGRGTGNYFFDFGADGSFIVRYSHAVWPTWPKSLAAATGTFHAEGKVDVTAGTGRFANATGNIASDGPFLAWNLAGPIPSGRFNNSITGMLCGVAAK